jgi:hypothetical protein
VSNSDPITGQAAWFDVRVRISPADDDELDCTSPQFPPLNPLPGQVGATASWIAYDAAATKRRRR